MRLTLRLWAVVLGGALLVAAAACEKKSPTAPVTRMLTGDWGFSVSAGPSCSGVLPFGYGVAPRGSGRLTLTQSDGRLSGWLSIGGTPSGTLEGTINVPRVQFSINLGGRNVGVKPEDEPCRVKGEAAGSTDGYCWVYVTMSGEFPCPYSCTASDHILWLDRGRGCQ
jgi:hypothetical protein